MIIYLFSALLPESSELLLTFFTDETMNTGFVLAPNKDLAVSPLHYCRIIPEGTADLFKSTRRCSHLVRLWRRRLLAAIILSFANKLAQEGVRTFLPVTMPKLWSGQSLILLEHLYINNFKILCQGFKNQ